MKVMTSKSGSKKRIALVGFGNVGREVLAALESAPDMEPAGVILRNPQKAAVLREELALPVVGDVSELSKVDGAVLAIASRAVPQVAPLYLEKGISTVDSFDIHGEAVMEMRKNLHETATKHGVTAVICAGWDPGLDSVVRALLEVIAPRGITYTNFGPGMSMGHTVAVKGLPGVRNALSETLPKGEGLHKRYVYVELEEGAVFEEVEKAIQGDPYFCHDETYVYSVEDVEKLMDQGHGVHMIRRGVSGSTHNQRMEFNMTLQNPAATAQAMVSSMRASFRQAPGCYTMLEIPPIDFLEGDRERLLRRLV